MQITGVMIAKVPKAHGHPLVLRNDDAAGGPTHVVTIYGVVEKAKTKARFFRLDVSAMKTSRTYIIPSNPNQ